MENTVVLETEPQACGAVGVLTSTLTGEVIGYRMGGARPGPTLLVSGFDPLMTALFEKLIDIPTLPWMWGQLYLVSLNALEGAQGGQSLAALEAVVFDDLVFLPPLNIATDMPTAVVQSHRTVLRACARMGMIAGRGLSSRR